MNWASRLAIGIAVVAGPALGGIAPIADAHAAAGATVGMVTKVENQAQIGSEPAAVGTLVHMNDTLQTGAKARLQVTFRDNTDLTLGENASVVIDRFVFDPDASVGKATLNVTKGAFRLVTGRISDMHNKDINVTTPVAALAVRGTDFWSGSIQGQPGVLLVHNSRLEVRAEECPEGPEPLKLGPDAQDTNPKKCRCAVTLSQAGEGTDIDRNNKCPGAPYQWPPEKIDAALSMTGFSVALGPAQAIPAAAAAAAAAGFAVSTSNNNNRPSPLPPSQPVDP